MNWFLALLALSSLSEFFLCLPTVPQNVFFNGLQRFLFERITSTYFFLDFMLHCLRGQTRAIPVQIHCQSYAGGAGAACPSQPARPNPPDSGFHANIPFCYIPQPISHLVVALSHLFVALSHLLVCHKNLRCIAENLGYSMTQELVRLLYSTCIAPEKLYSMVYSLKTAI